MNTLNKSLIPARPPRPKGIPCRKCGCCEHEVVRTTQLPDRIRRQRECTFCKFRFNTYESLPGEYVLPVAQDDDLEDSHD